MQDIAEFIGLLLMFIILQFYLYRILGFILKDNFKLIDITVIVLNTTFSIAFLSYNFILGIFSFIFTIFFIFLFFT